MYQIIGGDGKEYGPVSLEQLRDWLRQGRINGATRIKTLPGTEWRAAAETPELAPLFAPGPVRQSEPGVPPPIRIPPLPRPRQALAVASFVLGLVSWVLCLSALTAIPAIICGHIARARAARKPQQHGGKGWAAAGLSLSYSNLLLSFVVLALLLPALPRTRPTMRATNCQHHLREIGLAFKIWALDHNDQYPFNVSTNAGGTRELCAPGQDGYDRNALAHFLIISNELSDPAFLVCPKDNRKHAASTFQQLQEANVSYRLRTGTNINSDHPEEVLAVCPIDGNRLYCDGNVRSAPRTH